MTLRRFLYSTPGVDLPCGVFRSRRRVRAEILTRRGGGRDPLARRAIVLTWTRGRSEVLSETLSGLEP
jgi:hypothetical protein